MNISKLLLILPLFICSLSAEEKSKPLDIPEWFLNPPPNYVVGSGSTIEKAFLSVLNNYASIGQLLSSSLSKDTTNDVISHNIEKQLEASSIGNIEVNGYTRRVQVEELDTLFTHYQLVFMDDDLIMNAYMEWIQEEIVTYGEDREYIDHISHSYENCNLGNLIEHVKTHGYEIKHEVRENRYFFLLGKKSE